LSADSAHSVESACALQADVVSIPARRLSALLDALPSNDRDASEAVDLLRPWDCRLSAESGPAALFEMWWTNCLRPALLDGLVDDPHVRGLVVPGDIESLLRILEKRDPLPAPRGLAVDRLLTTTLADAFRRCAAVMGSEPGSWSWGRLHAISFAHSLSTLDPSRRLAPEAGPFALPGSESTVMKAAYRPDDFRVVMGASVRIVMDVGDWDRSVWINAPGQSGDPRSPHYADLAARWADGKYVPMLYSSRAVDAASDHRIILLPE